ACARDGEEVRALVAEFVFEERRLVVEDLLSYDFERERARGRQRRVARTRRANLILDAVVVGLKRVQLFLKVFERLRLRGLAAEAHARQLRGDLLLSVLVVALLLQKFGGHAFGYLRASLVEHVDERASATALGDAQSLRCVIERLAFERRRRGGRVRVARRCAGQAGESHPRERARGLVENLFGLREEPGA